jgi:hypothetical protein
MDGLKYVSGLINQSVMRLLINTEEKLSEYIIKKIFDAILDTWIQEEPLEYNGTYQYYSYEDETDDDGNTIDIEEGVLIETAEKISNLDIEEIEQIILDAGSQVGKTLYSKSKNPKFCKHEFVFTEYTSQPYGTCATCKSFVVKKDGEWHFL